MENTNYHKKSVDELTFTDDGMFQAVLRDPEICAELVERLLHVKVNHVDYPKLEKQIAPYYSSKGVRLDVYLKDTDKVIDVEMQSSPQEALGKRTRYYEAMVDIDSLLKGQDYTELKDSYILFICKTDPFKDDDEKHFGLPCYTFRNICAENNYVELDDKSLKVIYNSSAYEKESNEKIRDFLKYIYTNEPGEDDFSKRISAMVEKIKDNDKFRRDYAAMNLHDRDIQRAAKKEGIAVGFEQGTRQKAVETARNMLKIRLGTVNQISQITNLPIEEINNLAKGIL